MRHAPCVVVYAVLAISATPDAFAQEAHVIVDDSPLSPGDAGWYGVQWGADAFGALLPQVEVTSPRRSAEQWLTVSAIGNGVERSWVLGPYAADGSTFTVPVTLDAQTFAPGLIRVTARLDLFDPTTGARIASRRTSAAYVADAGILGEAWYDEATAEAIVVRNLAFAVPEGVEIEGLVGFEVSP